MTLQKENPPLQARNGGRHKNTQELTDNIIPYLKSEFQIRFDASTSQYIKIAAAGRGFSRRDCILRWVQEGLNRDYFNERL